jgi:hypothetical protein
VGQLNARYTALVLDKSGDALQLLNMSILPQSQIVRRYSAFWRYGGCLAKNQRCSPDRPAAQVHKMPVIGKTIFTRVLAHGRYYDPVFQGNAPYREGREELGNHLTAFFSDLLKVRILTNSAISLIAVVTGGNV